ncbi:MAG: urease accessory protein UreH domain-containing protein, partial [Candidatus Hodarchaeales archaeon]
GRTIRAGVVLLRLEILKQKSPHPDGNDLHDQKLFREISAIAHTTFAQEFANVEQISSEDIAAIVSDSAQKLHEELRMATNLAELMNSYLEELNEAGNIQQELIQEFITKFQRETEEQKAKSPWPRRRAVLAYYLGRWTNPIGLGVLALAAFVHAFWYEAQGDYQQTLGYLAGLLTFVVMLSIWFWLEAGLFPHPPKDSGISQKAYLTQIGGYFDNPKQFALWFVWTLIFGGLILLAMLLTIQTISSSNDHVLMIPSF